MLYVIQTESGKEIDTVTEIRKKISGDVCSEAFTIRYENILRRNGTYHINTRVLFPAYVFVNTDNPDRLFLELKKVLNLSVLLSDKSEKGYTFFKVSDKEEELIRKLLNDNEDYTVTLSMVVYNSKKKINRSAGPLKYFLNMITEVDSRHRRAFVTMNFLGRPRRLVFGICMKGDNIERYNMHRLEEELAAYSNMYVNADGSGCAYGNTGEYVGMSPYGVYNIHENVAKDYNLKTIEVGDKVIIRTGLYGEKPVKVLDINGKQNVEMLRMDVEKV